MLLMVDELTNAVRAEFFTYSFNFPSKSNGHLWATLEAFSVGVGTRGEHLLNSEAG